MTRQTTVPEIDMTEEQAAALLTQITALTGELKTHVDKSCSDMAARFDAAMGEIQRKKTDAAGSREGENGDDLDLGETGARLTAADSALRADVRYVKEALRDLQLKQPTRRPADRDALAETQARCDVAFRAHSKQADPPLSGEGAAEYSLRLHRDIQRLAPTSKWAKADLTTLVRDPATYERAVGELRADAVAASYSPEGLQPFIYREVKKTSPGGHQITEFVGNGTFVAAMSPPVRKVKSIGYQPGMLRVGGGSAYFPAA
jgi:hypothetical protein